MVAPGTTMAHVCLACMVHELPRPSIGGGGIDTVAENSIVCSPAVSYRIMSQRAGGTSVASQPAQVTFGTGSGSSSSSGSGGLSLAA